MMMGLRAHHGLDPEAAIVDHSCTNLKLRFEYDKRRADQIRIKEQHITINLSMSPLARCVL